jgi:hypothetical protein
MADDELVEELAEHLARSIFTANRLTRPDGKPIAWDDLTDDQRQHWMNNFRELHAAPALEWLAERGRLIPDGAETIEQWETWCHARDSDAIRHASPHAFPSRQQAEEWGQEQIGQYGITRYTVLRRVARRWPDGSAMTGPWEPVPEEAT